MKSQTTIRGVAGAAGLLLALLVVGCSSGPGKPDTAPTSTGSTQPGGTASPAGEVELEKGCEPSRRRPGPAIDLQVQSGGVGRELSALDPAQVGVLVEQAQDAGATVVSTIASWNAQQRVKGGAYDWGPMDDVISAARARDLKVRLIVQMTPGWARDDTSRQSRWVPPRSAEELRLWQGYLTDLVEHVEGRVDYLQVWTDPNAPRAWITGPDPGEFAELLAASYSTIKSAAPAMKVVSGALSSNAVGYLEKLYAYRDAELAGVPLFDLLGLNPASRGKPPGAEVDVRQVAPFGDFDQTFLGYRLIRGVMAQNGDSEIPIYIGRFGYRDSGGNAVSDATRASFVSQAYELATCDKYVAALSWYLMHPVPWDSPDWALTDGKGRPNLTYDALQGWSREFQAVRNRDS